MTRRPLLPLFLAAVLSLATFLLTPRSSSQSSHHSLSLNGTNQYVSVSNSSTLDISGPITVEAWIKLNSNSGNYQDIVCRENWGQAGSGGGYEFSITNTGKLRLDLYQSHNQYTTAIGGTTVTTGIWHHVAGVFDGNQMRVYLDGTLDGSLSTTSGPAAGTSALNIGKSTYGTYYFGGLIDDVRISAAALYSSNFTAGLGPANNTRALWRFDGQTANDFSGNGNHGTLQNGASFSTNVPSISNSSPTISLTHPLNNATYAPGATVVIDVTANDVDGAISNVEFYQGSTLLGSDSSAPYVFVWSNVAAGTYSITAKAFDDVGATATTSAISVVVASSAQHSLSLNGSSQYVSVLNSSTINVSGPITIEAWIKLNSNSGNYQDIVCRENWGQAGSGGGYEFSITNTGKLRLDLYQSHNQYTTAIGGTTVTTGVWHHVAGVFDGNQMRVYLDGALDGSLSTTSGPASGTSALNIGKSTYTAYYFGGLIDDVRISAAALYSSNFTAGLGPANNTRALWRFDGQTANDFSGNGNHGTLQNGAPFSTNVPSVGGAGNQLPIPEPGEPYEGKRAQSINFSSNGSFDPDGTIASYLWNFGDGTSANTANPSHSYQTSGLFTATLTVTDNLGLRASATTTVSISGNLSEAMLDPANETGGGGENPLSGNFNWTLPLVSLPGRAGLDLNLSLSYNSLVWTRNGNIISFDDDYGFPGPGFRLGFPSIRGSYLNLETGKWSYLLIGSDGRHTELRQVDANPALYESADSTHLLLDTSELESVDPFMLLRATDGTQLTYKPKGLAYECTEIKDRNGNYITINYHTTGTALGRIASIHDTLDRTITFVYDNGLLSRIEQSWKQPTNPSNQMTHTWASFAYLDLPVQTNFTNLTVVGPTNNTRIKVLAKVTLGDHSTTPANNSRYEFSYTSWAQVWKISNRAPDGHLLNYRAYSLPGSDLQVNSPQTDCPRFTQRRDWARYWNGDIDRTPASDEEAITSFTKPVPNQSWTMPDGSPAVGTRTEVTLPNGTKNKIYFITGPGWSRGLPALVDTYDSNGVRQRRAATTWTQDDELKAYIVNPRIAETNTYDSEENRKRTRVEYRQIANTTCRLPEFIYEYKADASNYLRTTKISYIEATEYTSRRILGLISERKLIEGYKTGPVKSWVSYAYDENGSVDATNDPIKHDNTHFGPSFVVGRANVTSKIRHDVNTGTLSTETRKYDRAGSLLQQKDPGGHEINISYADNFSDGNNSRATFAYAKTVTDAGNFIYTSTYNFDFGGITNKQTPKPDLDYYQAGPVQTMEYDDLGRLSRITNSVNAAYTRYVYSSSGTRVDVYSTVIDGASEQNGTEAHVFTLADGVGRVIAKATGRAAGGFNGQRFEYDEMGRVKKTSNPTETAAVDAPESADAPFGWNTTGADAGVAWKFTEQTYDWKGRPRITTNPDGTTREANYTGCGCAGGEKVTLTDEGTGSQRREQRVYSDVLGRTVKTEVLNWQGGTIYSTTVNTYNVRDQITQIRQYAGTETSTSFRDSTMTYDGFGRLETQHTPEQQAETNHPWTSDHTTFHYDSDDRIDYIIDARGVVKNFSYNNRHLLTGVSYDLSNIPTAENHVANTSAATFEYDSLGNRKKMTDGTGTITYHYNELAQLTSETRVFTEFQGPSYTLSYEYNLGGQLKRITDPTNHDIKYVHDRAGEITEVNGGDNPFASVPQYASAFEYRAWGALKNVSFFNGTHQQVNYNSRLLPVNASLNNLSIEGNSSATMSWSYDYYDDGRQQHAYDASDNRFDRKLKYDHLGRLTEASSGREARGLEASSPYPDSPYRLSFEYDQFNNRTLKAGRLWRMPQPNGLSLCVPRQPGDGCDSEGNLTAYSDDVHVYDAAGKQVRYENWRRTVGGFPNHPEIEPGVLLRQTYDADGRPTKRVETRSWEEVSGSVTNVLGTEVTTRYIYSTPLGGAKLIELGGGIVSTTYVYANGVRIAKQREGVINDKSVVWYHPNPGTNSWVETDVNRSPLRQEMDPDGAEVGTEDPWDAPVEPPTYENLKDQEPLYIEGGDPFDYTTGYSIDGLPVTQAEYNRRMGNGSAGVQLSAGGRPVAFTTNQQLLYHVTFDVFQVSRELGAHYMGSFDLNMNLGFAQGKPQNPATRMAPIGGLDRMQMWLEEALKYKTCREDLQKLLAQIGSDTKFAPSHTDILDLFNALKNQTGAGGIFVDVTSTQLDDILQGHERGQREAGGGGESNFFYTDRGNWRTRQRWSAVFVRGGYADTQPSSFKRLPYVYVLTLIHEITHNAPNDSSWIGRTYQHSEMNGAAIKLGSTSFDQYVREKCIPQKYW